MLIFYYPDEPILHRPTLPVPGEDRDGESWPSHPLPLYMGRTFPVICNLWTIAQEVAAVYFSDRREPIYKRVPVAYVEAKYRSLLACMDTLDEDMIRGDHNPAHVVMLQWVYPLIKKQCVASDKQQHMVPCHIFQHPQPIYPWASNLPIRLLHVVG